MSRISIAFISFLFLAACTQDKRVAGTGDTATKEPADVNSPADSTAAGEPEINATIITCNGIGLIKLSDAMTGLERKIGKSNLTQDSLMLEGMFNGFVTSLWKGTKNELTVRWNEDGSPYKTIKFIEISNPLAPYRFANGVGIGTTLTELVKLNGGTPISLYGFGWDYGGTFQNFNHGRLFNEMPCFGGVFQLPRTKNFPQKDYGIVGDRVIKSNLSALQKYDVKLVTIRIKNK